MGVASAFFMCEYCGEYRSCDSMVIVAPEEGETDEATCCESCYDEMMYQKRLLENK